MAIRQTQGSSSTPLLLFGPQLTKITSTQAAGISNAVSRNPRLKFLGKAVRDAHHILELLHAALPSVNVDRILPQLQALDVVVLTGTLPDESSLGSSFYGPLTVVRQAIAYLELDIAGSPQGFCLGFLVAAAIATANGEAEIEQNLQRALSLAIVVGAIADTDESHGPVQTYSVQWKTPAALSALDDFLRKHTKSYISCHTDTNRATVTVVAEDEPRFLDEASKHNLHPLVVGLRQRYHWKRRVDVTEALEKLCSANEGLQLPDAAKLQTSLRSNIDAQVISSGNLTTIAIRSLLVEPSNWYSLVTQAVTHTSSGRPEVIQLGGSTAPVPSFLLDSIHVIPTDKVNGPAAPVYEPIAVIGVACRYPRSDSVNDFWNMLAAGESAVGPVPTERFDVNELEREPKYPFMGNFLDRPDRFDHRFFKVSGKEAKSMDPQQRLALSVAYETLESAGYATQSVNDGRQVGCYLGVGSVDYEANVASENATAFSATGTLRAFISGRISHHFGWTGPSLTFDTACSSSAVAIHSACRALHLGECDVALAGGVNVITAPSLYQNLAAASFLNRKGASKAFDADASGYCRGEGAGLVLLKPLRQALADSDFIVGTIGGSAVNQGDSCTPITVPHSVSQSALYDQALRHAGVKAHDVSFVEAHGTGTVVGDPIECESIRRTFGSPERTEPLLFGSVKDNIGHTEAASGAAGLLKVLLMMQNRAVPRQANFQRLNPSIPDLEPDRMAVPTQLTQWKAPHLMALVNNYGAAGSNAALLVKEHRSHPKTSSTLAAAPVPFGLYANTEASLRAYARRLSTYIQERSPTLADLAFNLAHKRNTDFDYFYGWVSSDTSATLEALDSIVSGSATISTQPSAPPGILCFGGQGAKLPVLSPAVYEASPRLQYHMNRCHAVLLNLGFSGLLPGIFSEPSPENVLAGHVQLFCIQYACAMAWIDSGFRPVALVGHSFGQLTALCVGGAMSLSDALTLITARARLIREKFGNAHGGMLAVTGPLHAVERLIVASCADAEIVCLNGETNFVVAGPSAAIEAIEKAHMDQQEPQITGVTRLNSSYAYHSKLLEPILDELSKIANRIRFEQPTIPVETCSENNSWPSVTSEHIVQHTREPVYFQAAVERLSKRYGTALWLEAGTSSPVISMVRRVLAAANEKQTYVSTDLTNGLAGLSDVTVSLNRSGVPATFWPFDRSKTHSYQWLPVPPFQFEDNSHWIDYRAPKSSAASLPLSTSMSADLLDLLNSSSSGAQFIINPEHELYKLCVTGHAVIGQSLCPASLYLEMAGRAIGRLTGAKTTGPYHFQRLEILSPLTLFPQARLVLQLAALTQGSWSFELSTLSSEAKVLHAKGHASVGNNDQIEPRLASLEQIVGSSKHRNITEDESAETLSGSIVYKVFGSVVDYADYFRGVRKLVAGATEALGDVRLPPNQPQGLTGSRTAPIAVDNFLQVAGIHVNCLTPCRSEEVYVCTAIDELILRPDLTEEVAAGTSWKVYSNFRRISPAVVLNDIYIMGASTGRLCAIVQGARFTSVSLKALTKTLSRLNGVPEHPKPSQPSLKKENLLQLPVGVANPLTPPRSSSNDSAEETEIDDPVVDDRNSMQQLREVIARVLEVPVEDVSPTAGLADLGIDSLLSAEVATELNKEFGINLSGANLVATSDLPGLFATVSPSSAQTPVAKTSSPKPKKQPVQRVATAQDNSDSGLCQPAYEWLSRHRTSYDTVVHEAALSNFRSAVYPSQMELVTAYIVQAFSKLGCDLEKLHVGAVLPAIRFDPKHDQAVQQYYRALEEFGIIECEGTRRTRTEKPLPSRATEALLDDLVRHHPKHRSEHLLLDATGSRLADCLNGSADPIELIFKNASARELLQDVYTNAPMFKAGSLFLARFLVSVLAETDLQRPVRILELGAGTGGTTSYLLQQIASSRQKFQYTFSDLSPSLVAAAKKKFAKYDFMQYTVVDIEKSQPKELVGQFDIIISTNCIHATRNLVTSGTNINTLLRRDGILCLVELTQNLFWFDLVFGLLEGWWLFNDGRTHALATADRWNSSLTAADFSWVDWSQGNTLESDILRLIVASPSPTLSSVHELRTEEARSLPIKETVTYKEVDGLSLQADVYYPSNEQAANSAARPVALMIHGGGHIMLSRKDVRSQQTSLLLKMGFLPISIDYRLCPEIDILHGSMADVCDALKWIRSSLPLLKRADVKPDPTRVVAIGWSTGGHLAMTLAWTAKQAGIAPPEAVLAFYNPSDYSDVFWHQSNVPRGSEEAAQRLRLTPADLQRGVFKGPILAYNPPPQENAAGGWMAPEDARSRIALWSNWNGKHLQVILRGLPRTGEVGQATQKEELALEEIEAINPRHWIDEDVYRTPTFLIHGTEDDLIPWQQAKSTLDALQRRGVAADGRIIDGAVHLFDVVPGWRSVDAQNRAVQDGYEFLKRHAGL